MDMYINPSDRNPIELSNTELTRNTDQCLSAQGQNIDGHYNAKDKIDSKEPNRCNYQKLTTKEVFS